MRPYCTNRTYERNPSIRILSKSEQIKADVVVTKAILAVAKADGNGDLILMFGKMLTEQTLLGGGPGNVIVSFYPFDCFYRLEFLW